MPAWPATLPQFVLESGYQEQLQDQVIETQMETGPVKVRRRFTKSIRTFQCQMLMTAAQQAAFESFWQNDCLGGSISFTWVHPRTRVAATFRFRTPAPQYQTIGGTHMLVFFALEQL